jgi:hypothetical protein
LRYGANNPERRQLQVIAQSRGQVILLLFSTVCFVDSCSYSVPE